MMQIVELVVVQGPGTYSYTGCWVSSFRCLPGEVLDGSQLGRWETFGVTTSWDHVPWKAELESFGCHVRAIGHASANVFAVGERLDAKFCRLDHYGCHVPECGDSWGIFTFLEISLSRNGDFQSAYREFPLAWKSLVLRLRILFGPWFLVAAQVPVVDSRCRGVPWSVRRSADQLGLSKQRPDPTGVSIVFLFPAWEVSRCKARPANVLTLSICCTSFGWLASRVKSWRRRALAQSFIMSSFTDPGVGGRECFPERLSVGQRWSCCCFQASDRSGAWDHWQTSIHSTVSCCGRVCVFSWFLI